MNLTNYSPSNCFAGALALPIAKSEEAGFLVCGRYVIGGPLGRLAGAAHKDVSRHPGIVPPFGRCNNLESALTAKKLSKNGRLVCPFWRAFFNL
ncbi:hypothetical protein A0123_03027 [Gluconobacter cerinus]|uniref:Uncharacterized protein n=1 Tax=Gluconobacter cerinus TaxID=38307 RepID=A0A1B6VGN3_9PROT|nr:hypothetical protein A0123_03027 [Gluconobacter cerinus]